MLFIEFRFIGFFLVVFGVHWLLRSNRARKLWLLVCSYVFYAAWDWRFLTLIFVSTGLDYVAGQQVYRQTHPAVRRAWLICSLVVNLGLLGVFKYYGFFADSAVAFFQLLGLPATPSTLEIVLPVGISFYTFQSLSYTLDISQGRLRPIDSLRDFALFVAFFPQLVAGPIVRASAFLPQLGERRRFATVDVRACLVLFLIGFFKKACVSDNVAVHVDAYFAAPEQFTAASAQIAVLLYAVQIYCDFSGYSDMAIATAGLLGYRLPLNFAFPYFAPDLRTFWRRWHISLSTWLRDYLYIPLGGNRSTTAGRRARNVMLTMVLGGLWHGAAWRFVIWGGLHGAGLLADRWSAPLRATAGSLRRARTGAGVCVTFVTVCIAWIFFRAPSLADARIVLSACLSWTSWGEQALPPALWGVFAALAIVHWVAYRGYVTEWWQRLTPELFAAGYGVAAAVLVGLAPVSYEPFIYFQF